MTDVTTKSQANQRGRRFFTAVYNVPSDWTPGEGILNDPLFLSASWTHALHDRDVALACALEAQTKSLDKNPIFQTWSDGSGGWGDTTRPHFEQATVNKRRIVYLQPTVTAVGVPSIVREALDIAHDLAIAEAQNVHTTYAGYKQHKHDAVDRDVATVKQALEAVESAPDAELVEMVYTAQELEEACQACDLPVGAADAVLEALKANRAKSNSAPAPRIKTMALCASTRLGMRPNQPYIFQVRAGCKDCETLAEPYAKS